MTWPPLFGLIQQWPSGRVPPLRAGSRRTDTGKGAVDHSNHGRGEDEEDHTELTDASVHGFFDPHVGLTEVVDVFASCPYNAFKN